MSAPPPGPPLLEVKKISVRFGGVAALDGVTFTARAGELLGLIGPNGAGKTTLLRVITGVVRASAGRVSLDGHDLGGLPTHRRVRLGLGLSQQLVRPFRSMTVLDNVVLAAGHGQTRRPLAALFRHGRAQEEERAHHWLRLVGIEGVAAAMPSALPLGRLKRLELARALALEPAVLLLDEPLAGLNQAEAGRLAETIRGLAEGGRAIVLIEHNLAEVLRISDRLVVLDNGRRIAEGAPQEVIARPDVRAAYLGEAAPSGSASHA
jgi:branched-chain amino acid transport system ATP-binding protein